MIVATVQHLKTLADKTQRLFVRFEGGELPEPVVQAISLFNGEIVLAERVKATEPTAKIPAIRVVEMSPSLYAPTLEGNGLN